MKQAVRQELTKLVRHNFSSMAMAASQVAPSETWPELLKLADDLGKIEGQKKVLDLGCGQGLLLEILPQAQINYLGVDNCQEAIEKAKKRYPAPNIKFVQADILRLNELPEIGFDYVFSLSVLHHVPSAKLRLEAFKQLKNKIKSGGSIYLSVNNFWSDKKYRKLIIKFLILKLLRKHDMDSGDIIFDAIDEQGKIISQRYYHAFTLKELKGLANQADLKIDKLYKDEKNYYLVMHK